MTYLAAPLGLLLLFLTSGCGGEASPLAWSIRFEDSADRDATAVVATRVIEGGCDGSSTVYIGNINLRAGGSAPQPDELGSGLHGFSVEARGLDCTVIDSVCDDYELPLEQMAIVSVLTGAGGGGGGCSPGSECDGSGSCIPIPPSDSDVPLPCDTEGAACDDGMGGAMGVCHMGACCLGCWDGADCQAGTTAAACGASGDACLACDPGDSCQGASCVVTSTSPTFSMAPKSNFYRHSNGAYWANSDGTFMQSGPVSGAENTLMGYTGALRFADIAAAEVATAGITLDGDLYTWGTNAAGALGSGSTMFTMTVATPTQVATLDKYREITAGGSFFCAIRLDGTLWCWGTNANGQLGVGDTTFRAAPTQVGSRSWVTVAALFEHACAIRDDRTLWCWGKGENGRLGDGMEIDRMMPVQVGTAADWVQVSAGVGHTCGIRAVAGARRLYCWGRANSGVLGIGDTGMTASFPEPQEVRDDLTGWQQVSAGNFHTCALLDRSMGVEALCWGFGGFGALGTGSVDMSNTPAPVDLTPNSGWTFIFAGHDQSCGVADGTRYCWGDSRIGWLGIGMSGDAAIAPSPTEVVFDPSPP